VPQGLPNAHVIVQSKIPKSKKVCQTKAWKETHKRECVAVGAVQAAASRVAFSRTLADTLVNEKIDVHLRDLLLEIETGSRHFFRCDTLDLFLRYYA
jgi:hypothetical protein